MAQPIVDGVCGDAEVLAGLFNPDFTVLAGHRA
jgi:hypothetical protein